MSVSDLEPVKTTSGNGVNKTFDFDFLINNESELLVQYTDSNGVQSSLVLNTDYSINAVGNPAGSFITFPLASSSHSILSSNEKITLSLDLKFKQEGGYNTSGGLTLGALENSFDYLTRIAQILRRKIDRCVKVKEGSGVNPDELVANLEASALAAANSASDAAQTLNDLNSTLTSAVSSATSAASSSATEAAASAAISVSNAQAAATSATNAQAAAGSLGTLITASGDEGKFLQVATPYNTGYVKKTAAEVRAILDINAARLNSDRLYDGVDLSTKFATEIAGYASVWAWIKARTQAGNFDGIHVGDYIPFTLSAGTAGGISVAQQSMKAQIAGIDTYYGFGDTPVAHHIDFVSKDVIDTPIQWQPNDNNNGTSVTSSPWLSSKVYAWLNGVNNYTTSSYGSAAHGLSASGSGILQLLPAALQSAIVTKRQLLEYRYSSSGLLTYDNSWAWGDMGALWLPHEIEVYGCQIWSACNYSNGTYSHGSMGGVHYPLFACQGGYHGRVKTNSSGSRASWWLSAVYGGSSAVACVVDSSGVASGAFCSYSSVCVPVCFRIA